MIEQALGAALERVLGALAVFGYPIVFVATALENTFVVGTIVPGDVITAGAAVAAATDPSASLSPLLLVAIAAAGGLVGANISYWLGRRGGTPLILRLGSRFGIDDKAIDAAAEYFERRGAVTIFLARFVAVMKSVAPALAGALRMNLLWFELYSLLSAVVYSCVLVAVGWFLGENYKTGLKVFGAFSWVLLVAVVVAGFWLWSRKRHHDAELIERNAAEFEQEHGEVEEEL